MNLTKGRRAAVWILLDVWPDSPDPGIVAVYASRDAAEKKAKRLRKREEYLYQYLRVRKFWVKGKP